MSQFTTLNEMFQYTLKNYGDKPIYFSKDNSKQFKGVTFRDTYRQAQNVALCLIDMGLEPRDRVGLMADNRYEWAVADMAVLLNGASNVPRGSDSNAAEIEYILEHSGSKFCFVEHEKLLNSILPIADKTSVQKFIVLDKSYKSKDSKVLSFYDLIEKGESLREKHLATLEKRTNEINEEDLFTIIYTSGTTGLPKGVMLTHRNMVYNVVEVPKMIGIVKSDKTLTILPVWHIFERAMYYAIIANGVSYYYTNVRDLRDDFGKVKPTFMASAPRLWENLYLGIKAKLEKASPIQKMIFDTAYEVCKAYREGVDYLEGNKLLMKEESVVEKAQNTATAIFKTVNLFVASKILDSVVFAKIRDVLGGAFRGTISGGGALPAHVDEFFNVIGIPVYEGYGMTECAPIISVRTQGHIIQGSVGYPPPGTEVRILNDHGEQVPKGELGIIHVKGPQVMKGYYNNSEATEKSLKNGWLNTGDRGFISFNNTVSVRGRVKDTIVLLGGENVEPVPIENLLIDHPHISQVIVVGQDQKSLTALIWPDAARLAESGFKVSEGENLNKNTALRSHFAGIVKDVVSSKNGFKSFEKVTDFRFLPKAMQEGDELTIKIGKMKRNVITDKYASLIKEMYS
ncbi:MAG: long-chain fatty acid--CoA ligase [Leptospiraceae bacterium]|nr:long-chain fatty acid--CoA ligase [Leptospiraceae bacterium]